MAAITSHAGSRCASTRPPAERWFWRVLGGGAYLSACFLVFVAASKVAPIREALIGPDPSRAVRTITRDEARAPGAGGPGSEAAAETRSPAPPARSRRQSRIAPRLDTSPYGAAVTGAPEAATARLEIDRQDPFDPSITYPPVDMFEAPFDDTDPYPGVEPAAVPIVSKLSRRRVMRSDRQVAATPPTTSGL